MKRNLLCSVSIIIYLLSRQRESEREDETSGLMHEHYVAVDYNTWHYSEDFSLLLSRKGRVEGER